MQIPTDRAYPTLHWLERPGWISAYWHISDNTRRARFYELTRTGRKQLKRESDEWPRLTAAVALVLTVVPGAVGRRRPTWTVVFDGGYRRRTS